MISFIILIWLIIDLALFPNFWQYLFDVDLKQLKHWQGWILFIIFFPMVCGFLFYKLCARLWKK